MTIYLDVVLIENLIMNYIILFATGYILKIKLHHIRLILSSLLGGIYSILAYMQVLEIYSNIIMKLILSIVMVYIAYKAKNVKILAKQIIIFYLISFVFGGSAFALLYFVKPQNISFQNGVLIGVSPIKIIITGGIIGFVIITISFKNIKGRLTKKDMICNLEIIQKDKKVKVKAIIDTGNFLTDPITKMPVVVVEKEKLIDIFPKSVLENTMDFVNGDNTEMEEYLSKIRIIPFKSLGKENGLLLGIKVDGVIINYQGNDNFIKEVIVGIYEKKLSSNNSYSALIGLNILEKGEDYDEHFRHVKN